MQFYDVFGNIIDTKPGINLANFRKNYLISALHVNSSSNIIKDINENIQWNITNGVYSTEEYCLHNNSICIPNNNNILLETPIKIYGRAFTIDFWMKIGISSDLTNPTDQEEIEFKINKNIRIELYSNTDLFHPFFIFYYNGFKNNSKYFTFSSNIDNTIWYDCINSKPDELHHITISYLLGNNINYSSDTTRRLMLCIDGLLGYYVTNSDIEFNGNMQSLIVKIINDSTSNSKMYIRDFRIFHNCVLFTPSETIPSDNTSFSRNFNTDLEIFKEADQKKLTYENFLLNKVDDNLYASYRVKYNPIALRVNTSVDDAIIYLSDSLTDYGTEKRTWSRTGYIFSYCPQQYTKYNTTALIDCFEVTGSTTVSAGHLSNCSWDDSKNRWVYSGTIHVSVNNFSGSIKANTGITLSSFPNFTIEYFYQIIKNRTAQTEHRDVTKRFGSLTYTYNSDLTVITIPSTFITTTNSSVFNHIAYVYSDNILKYYLNGILQSSTSYTPISSSLSLLVRNFSDNVSGGPIVTGGDNHLGIVIDVIFGQFRVTPRAKYTKNFDPIRELCSGSDIRTVLKSKTKLINDNNTLLFYPLENPATIYDIACSSNINNLFFTEYNTTAQLIYDEDMKNETIMPEDYKYYNPITSFTNKDPYNNILFRMKHFFDATNYQIEFWIYPEVNKEENITYIPIFAVAGLSQFVLLKLNANGYLTITYSTNFTINSSYSLEATYDPYNLELQNKWNHFILVHNVVNNNMTIIVNNIEIQVIENYNSTLGCLDRIAIPTGYRRKGPVSLYYVGIKCILI